MQLLSTHQLRHYAGGTGPGTSDAPVNDTPLIDIEALRRTVYNPQPTTTIGG